MTLPRDLPGCEENLRRALASGHIEEAHLALSAYYAACDECLASLDLSDPVRREILAQALKTLEWSTAMVKVFRSRCLDEFSRVLKLGAYLGAVKSPFSSIPPGMSTR